MSLFHLLKNNRFGLEYPNLEERKSKFMTMVLELVYDLDQGGGFNNQVNFSNELENLIILNKKPKKRHYEVSPLDAFVALNGKHHSDYYGKSDVALFLESSTKNYLEFLFVLDLFIKHYYKLKFEKKYIDSIANLFKILDLDYFWNKKTKQIEQKLDQANTLIINHNAKNIDINFGYQECVDEFLKPRKDINYLQSLQHIYGVLEAIVSKKNPNLRLNQSQKMAKFITDKTEKLGAIQQIFSFINTNIHHPIKDGQKYEFNESEYVYWWLEINKLIFMINSKNPKEI